MEYMTVAEAASKWSVSPRQVQRFLADSRIEGAKKHGRSWMIPQDARKPSDLRKAQGTSQADKTEKITAETQDSALEDFKRLIAASTAFILPEDPDTFISSLDDELLRLQYEAEFSYLRGDFEHSVRCYRALSVDETHKLRASSLAIASAISLGDYELYEEIESFLTRIIEINVCPEITTFAEQALSTACVSVFAPRMVPDWLRDGDFSAVIHEAKPDAFEKRAKYFQGIQHYESMLTVAQSALSFYDGGRGHVVPLIYLKTVCILAYYLLDRVDDARKHLSEFIDFCLPHGIITPLAESAILLGPLLEQCLEKQYPEYIKLIQAQWSLFIKNWIVFHNRFTQDNLTQILTLREYQIAFQVSSKVPYTRIAETHSISVGRLKNIVHEIYRKLFVSSRTELSQFIDWKDH